MSILNTDVAVRVEEVTKKYSMKGKPGLFRNPSDADIIAVNNLSIDIKQGEILGIIGRNGSGKSTLLRLLSGIEKPTSGRIWVQGKTAAILDIGSGFHPELTGRENVFFRGELLGIPKQVLKSRFDEIVAFSGVEKFIDTPVKHYSDGMFLRLAFSTIVHVEADVILFDEVLSVGDIDFQEKSRKKIHEIAQQGATVLIASHTMEEIVHMCDRVLSVDKGIYTLGRPADVVSHFRHGALGSATHSAILNDEYLKAVELTIANGDSIGFRDTFYLSFSPKNVVKYNYGMGIISGIGSLIVMSYIEGAAVTGTSETKSIKIDTPLNIGRYYIDFHVFDVQQNLMKVYPQVLSFDIEPNAEYHKYGENQTPFVLWEKYEVI